ncbi:YHS domain-containing protein [Geothermobacter ehrlichii]|uniref:YHS domain-containing protein n=1 Tax=Geothermobacter ehrlichii TaxID=213224 RepID=A0A5D3WNK6_9BACT|nr:transcriptional regulator [Geothermobacter ehrlichii]TYO99239.1 YHS domain-containing protein [Geothermobacter ehrlichii]
MIRLLLLAIFGFLFYVIWTALVRIVRAGRGADVESRPEKTVAGEEMVRDPVCGTYVPRSDAVQARIRGRLAFFCSTECRDAYRRQK